MRTPTGDAKTGPPASDKDDNQLIKGDNHKVLIRCRCLLTYKLEHCTAYTVFRGIS